MLNIISCCFFNPVSDFNDFITSLQPGRDVKYITY